ncbi:MAG: tRNA (N(6)-L-threonylcarbamoyladenosine(37)-C(2))-methylthiotransferase MtaB [Ruminococcaceae bacterium]|nr:tRNA (N(6)-L-threonylcarbamoyladenosine(37)-C(2))-methylthiotransferase MtaB [Oscillospiraceae bacterium]
MNETKSTVSVLTLGCRVNQYESDAFSAEMERLGIEIVPFDTPCDIAIVNTCTVTAESDRKSRKMIRRAAQNAEHVIVTGCYAQIAADEAAASPSVTYVCGNSGKHTLAKTVKQILCGTYTGETNAVTPPTDQGAVSMTLTAPMRTRSYIKIEDGCENKCAYCIINKARGPVRSKDPAVVFDEAKALAEAGTHEIILTGIETASYGMDFPSHKPYGHSLADLICEVAKADAVERIGLGSLDPTVMSDYFVGKVKGVSKLLPHFHLSIQSGCSRTLARMRRKYNADMALSAIERMKAAIPEVTFSADVIVGFPGETEEDFLETMEFCRRVRFLHLHIFPYSKRAGTEAAVMDGQIHEQVKRERFNRLEAEGKKINGEIIEKYIADHSESTGNPVRVLIEKNVGTSCSGHSEHFVEVKILGHTAEVGSVVEAYLCGVDGKFCTGKAK